MLLGLTNAHAETLFYAAHWPEPFGTSFSYAKAKQEQDKAAHIAAARIRHLIETGE
jgi:hypothetical protein